MSTITEYVQQDIAGVVNVLASVWVRLTNNVTGTTFVSTSVTDGNGLFTVNSVPPGTYTVATGPSAIGPWTNTGDNNFIVASSVPLVNVLDFGAKGNGSTDDTTAVTNACASGGLIYFPNYASFNANYLIGNVPLVSKTKLVFDPGVTITVKSGQSGFTLTGTAGSSTAVNNVTRGDRKIVCTTSNPFTAGTFIRVSGTPTSPINGAGPYFQIVEVTNVNGTTAEVSSPIYSSLTTVTAIPLTMVTDVDITGPVSVVGQDATAQAFVNANRTARLRVREITSTGMAAMAGLAGIVTISNSFQCTVERCHFLNSVYAGVFTFQSSQIRLTDNIIVGTATASSFLMRLVSPMEHVVERNNCSRPAFTTGGANVVDGILFDGQNGNVVTSGNAGNVCRNNTVINGGSGFANNGRGGIMFLDGTYNLIEGNSSQGSDFGIYMSTNCIENRIIGNDCSFNGGTLGYYGDGIEIDGGTGGPCSDNIIANNICNNNTGTQEGSGIHIRNGGSLRITIMGNTCNANTGDGIQIVSNVGGNVRYTKISGNQCHNNTGTAAGSVGAGIHIGTSVQDTTVVDNTLVGNLITFSDQGTRTTFGTTSISTLTVGSYAQWPNSSTGSINGRVQALPPLGGGNDDTANLAAQLTAAGTAQVAVGGQVDFDLPLGVYLTTGVTLPANVNLKGPGTLKLLSGTNPLVTVSQDNEISGVTFDLQNTINAVGIQVPTSGARIRIRGNTTKNSRTAGVNLVGAWVDVLIEGNTFGTGGFGVLTDSASTGDRIAVVGNSCTGGANGAGIEINSPSGRVTNITISGNVVSGYSSASQGIGIAVAHASYFTITSNTVENCGLDGIHVEDASYDGAITGNVVSGCNRSGITVNTSIGVSGTTTTTRRINIKGNTVNGNLLTAGTGGIAVEGSNAGQDFVIEGNISRANGRAAATCFGIDIAPSTANFQCAHNVVSNTNGSTTAGIRAQACVNSTIAFNRCYDDGSSTQLYGLQLNGVMSGLTLVGNDFTGNATGTINDASTGTQRQILIAGTADWTMNGGLTVAGLTNNFALASGYIAETLPRWNAAMQNAGGNFSSGTIRTQAIWLPSKAITNIGFWSGTTALTRGSNSDSHVWFGIADSTRKIVAITADDTSTAWAANSAHTLAINGGTYTPATAGFYYLFLMVNIGTGGAPVLPNLVNVSNTAANLISASGPLSPVLSGNNDAAQTTPLALNTVLAAFQGAGVTTMIYGFVS